MCALVQTALSDNLFSGQVFIFRGRRGDKLKVLWHEPEDLCLYCKQLNRGHFVWPRVSNDSVLLTSAQLSMLLAFGIKGRYIWWVLEPTSGSSLIRSVMIG